jgi:glycolate oxidase FAD binding subunit
MSTATATAIQRLAAIVGEAQVTARPDELAPYAADGVAPGAVVRPGTADEVAEVVRFAAAERLGLIPCAGRTKLGIGNPAQRYDLALDVSRLNRILAYDPGDLTLSVEAGIGIRPLLDTLAEKKQFLPLLVPFLDRATIGGILASNSTSPLRQFYGTERDWLLGLEFVTGEGARAKSGGRVVKNVAGYDLHKLLVGSLGTLGVITAANFRTFPLPRAQATLLAAFVHPAGALHLRRTVAQSPLQPHAFEVLSPHASTLLLSGMDIHRAGRWVAAIASGGHDSVVERHRRDLRELASRAGAEELDEFVGDTEEKRALWSNLREFPQLMLRASAAPTILKLSLPPSQLSIVLDQAQRLTDELQMPSALLVRAVGLIYVALLPVRSDAGAVALLSAASVKLCETAERAGGTAMIELCPTELKRSIKLWWPPRGDLDLMQRIKQAFDPHGVLSPGRFVGGL